jgi:hypothetical protein
MKEVVEIIVLPEYKETSQERNNTDHVKIDTIVKTQLHQFIAVVASMHHDNPFHNFEMLVM